MNLKKTLTEIMFERAKDHCLLWIIALLSLIAAIWSSIPALYCIDWVEVEEDTAKGINAVIQGLSFSYFAAWIFYMLSDVVPFAQQRVDSIKKLGTYYAAIDEAMKAIEGAAFMKKGSVPQNYTSKDLCNSVIETIESPLAPESSKFHDIKVPISSKLSTTYSLVAGIQIGIISRTLDDVVKYTNHLLPQEIKQILELQSSAFMSYFKSKQTVLIIVNDRDEITRVFDDFIKLRRIVAELKEVYS